jgi:hypothetical protein
MTDSKISALPAATTPLAGTEVIPIVQGNVTNKVTVANLTVGRAVVALSYSSTTGAVFGTTSGVVGIGVTPNNWVGSRAVQLGFAGAGAFSSKTGAFETNISNNVYFDGTNWIYIQSTAASRMDALNGNFRWSIAPNGTAGNSVTFTKVMEINTTGSLSILQATTAAAPTYVKGAMYYDTTLSKLRVGGATGWETVTSA